ncbi:hypothetical protein RFI_11799 [Reticulomyxa filosa]|uniref:Uncharacterized protein n=1 Tax=Reticulomyxa filosa TaxID=46433 RepID=X6NHG9_RETFI|nr:hypothetical protein RFI_11799 [Reticulomyxa filosa]|eukprot:ETO25338.1 hypothetical protein RFI_11799 [Reticulomyxa filosa]
MVKKFSDNVLNICFNGQAVIAILILLWQDFSRRRKKNNYSTGRHNIDHRFSLDHWYYLSVFGISMALLLCNIFIVFEAHKLYWSVCVGVLWMLFLAVDWVITNLVTANLTPWGAASITSKLLIIIGSSLLIINEILYILHYLDKTSIKMISNANKTVTPSQSQSDQDSGDQETKRDPATKHRYAYDTYMYANVGIFLAVDSYLEFLFARDIKFIAFHHSTVCAGIPGFLRHFDNMCLRALWVVVKWVSMIVALICIACSGSREYKQSPYWDVIFPIGIELWCFCLYCRMQRNRPPMPFRSCVRPLWRKLVMFFFQIAFKKFQASHPQHPVPYSTWEEMDIRRQNSRQTQIRKLQSRQSRIEQHVQMQEMVRSASSSPPTDTATATATATIHTNNTAIATSEEHLTMVDDHSPAGDSAATQSSLADDKSPSTQPTLVDNIIPQLHDATDRDADHDDLPQGHNYDNLTIITDNH